MDGLLTRTSCRAMSSASPVFGHGHTDERGDGHDFFDRNSEPRKEIIEGLHRESQLATIAGPFGVGKSPLLAHLTVCLLNGIPFCGRNVSKRPVVVFDFETAGPDYRRNLCNVADRFGVPRPLVPDELEVYLEHDSADERATRKLLEV